jgi:hypothetical protein
MTKPRLAFKKGVDDVTVWMHFHDRIGVPVY